MIITFTLGIIALIIAIKFKEKDTLIDGVIFLLGFLAGFLVYTV